MDLAFAHPGWIVTGILLMLIGIWLIRWASRNNMSAAIASSTKDAMINTMRKGGKVEVPTEIGRVAADIQSAGSHAGKAKKVAGYAARHAMSQLFGAAGFILAIAGLVLTLLGMFYV